jgi:hypothetical protein
MPVFPVHDMLTIHPALIRISYAYGYMLAADVHRQVQPRVESLASQITIKRLETILRRETLILPNLGTPLFDTDAEVEDLRRLKRELRELVHQRIVFGGVVPSDVHEWYTSWEEHRDRTALSLNQEYQLGIYSRPLGVRNGYAWGSGQSKQIVFTTGDGHIHELYVNVGGAWSHADLTALAGAPPASVVGNGYAWEGGQSKQIVFTAGYGLIHELYVSVGSAWRHADHTVIVGAPPG